MTPAGLAADTPEPIEVKMMAGLYSELPDINNAYWTEYQRLTNSKLDIEWVVRCVT